ncbi:MAG: alpha-glucan family phosphorylase, partial [Pseudomonadota bacterium]
LVQGVDVWLNNPRRPNEACGTSGMKAAANGALNLSVLDGWWPEIYDGTNGWAIGEGEEYEDVAYQDQIDAEYLYELLEEKVVPLFFDRGPSGLPHGWINTMKNSMAGISAQFNSHRMVEQYMDEYYVPAGLSHQILGENRCARAREFSEWEKRVRGAWKDIAVTDVVESRIDQLSLGEKFTVSAYVRLGILGEEEVMVDICHGRIEADTERLTDRNVTPMSAKGGPVDGVQQFEGIIPCDETGVYGYRIRILPFHPFLINPMGMNLVTWG